MLLKIMFLNSYKIPFRRPSYTPLRQINAVLCLVLSWLLGVEVMSRGGIQWQGFHSETQAPVAGPAFPRKRQGHGSDFLFYLHRSLLPHL